MDSTTEKRAFGLMSHSFRLLDETRLLPVRNYSQSFSTPLLRSTLCADDPRPSQPPSRPQQPRWPSRNIKVPPATSP
jgi:hypothetical protein